VVDRLRPSGNIENLVKSFPAPLLLLCATAAHAATVRGTVTVPADARPADAPSGHWRVENGLLPVTPRPPETREVVIVLDGARARGSDAEPPTVTVELHGLRLDPPLVVVPPAATVQFKNSDRVPHTLWTPNQPVSMPSQPTPAGQTRTQKFASPGEYRVRDEEWPHIEGTVLVVTSAAAQPDDRGNFKLDVPEGHYTLRVWYRGAWVLTQPFDVNAHNNELAVQIPPTKKPSGERGRAE
jgi:plastocyanin